MTERLTILDRLRARQGRPTDQDTRSEAVASQTIAQRPVPTNGGITALEGPISLDEAADRFGLDRTVLYMRARRRRYLVHHPSKRPVVLPASAWEELAIAKPRGKCERALDALDTLYANERVSDEEMSANWAMFRTIRDAPEVAA